MAKKCKCGCGEELAEGAVREYKNGHKSTPPPSDDDATEEQPDAYSICLTEAQMNNLWDKLEPGVKAVALDAALNVEV